MTELVRAGKIYIAQPPLYQIKRKKREEYVDDDVQLNKILISLGAEDVRLKNLADDKEITPAQLKDILESLEKLAKLSEAVRRHGGDFETYLAERNSKSGKLPTYLVKATEMKRPCIIFTTRRRFANFIRITSTLICSTPSLARNCCPLGRRRHARTVPADGENWPSCMNPPRSKKSLRNWHAKV